MADKDPFPSSAFYLDLGSIYDGPILKVTGLSYERATELSMQTLDSGMHVVNQQPGKAKPGTITVHKAVTENMGLWTWRQQVLEMNDISKVRVNGSIIVIDYAHNGVKIVWDLIGAWPTKITGPIIDAGGKAAFEELEICYQELNQPKSIG